MTRFRRVLVANRGEIAVRVIRACRELGLETVAIHSDADAGAPHTLLADVTRAIGPAPATQSYLAIERVIAAARDTGADAVHPGYGFLSENAAFAAACDAAGLVFVGPPAGVIARMGSKTEARALVRDAGVPVVPGTVPRDQGDEGIAAAARDVGVPVLLKASAGGGGKGMRLVRDDAALVDAIGAARREAVAAFGDGTLYVERLIERPRHVEIQVLADHHGEVVHLFERECSAQRRHQKVIEESPSPALTPALRARMGEAAVRAARAAGYRNAGTVEFLVEGRGDQAQFYFLEMNTRLQVEHPVTEGVTGLDLVHLQLAIAAGEPLPFAQHDVAQRGHAIECRVYAEDPEAGFLPQAGRLLLYREPDGAGVRVDSGVVEGGEVTVHYDPLLAKLIVHAPSREVAIARARSALRQFPILGIRTNVPFLLRLLAHPAFAAGEVDTHFIERDLAALVGDGDAASRARAVAAAVALAGARRALAGTRSGHTPIQVEAEPWQRLAAWRN